MKKSTKIAVVSLVGLLSTTAFAMQDDGSSTNVVSSICDAVPLMCTVTSQGNGSGKELPDKPKEKNQ